jgi:DNA-directed RNA polymerase alpha subunit
LEELFEIEGLTQDQASEILKNAKAHYDAVGDVEEGAESGSDDVSDLDRLPLSADLREMLISAGFKTIQSLVEADDDALRQVSGIEELDVEQIRQAVDTFLRGGAPRAPLPTLP